MWFFKKKDKIHILQIYFSRLLFYFCLAFFILFITRFFIVGTGLVNGKSMEKTYLDNEIFFVNKYVYLLHTPQRYDVVQLLNRGNDVLLIKRIIGLPGEVVTIKRGKVYIQKNTDMQEVELDELKYLSSNIYTMVKAQQGAAKFLVGNNQYFVMGDNRADSVDSRIYGPVNRTQITGKVMQHFLDIFR